LDSLSAKAKADESVLAVLLFGSAARGEQTPASDLDICLVLDPQKLPESSQKRLEYLAKFDFDLQIFQQLPLYVRHRVLQEGRVLYSRDDDALYEVAFRTAQAYEDFKHIYRDYLEAVARG
jgi:hypothetical protein